PRNEHVIDNVILLFQYKQMCTNLIVPTPTLTLHPYTTLFLSAISFATPSRWNDTTHAQGPSQGYPESRQRRRATARLTWECRERWTPSPAESSAHGLETHRKYLIMIRCLRAWPRARSGGDPEHGHPPGTRCEPGRRSGGPSSMPQRRVSCPAAGLGERGLHCVVGGLAGEVVPQHGRRTLPREGARHPRVLVEHAPQGE